MSEENQDQQTQPKESQPDVLTEHEKTLQERIRILEEKLQKVSKIAHIQRSELRNAGLRVNNMERALMVTQNRLDEVGSVMIYFIRKYGVNSEYKVRHEDLENLVPGTVIDDTQQDEQYRYLKVIEVPMPDMNARQPPMPPGMMEEMGVPPALNKDDVPPKQDAAAPQLSVVADEPEKV